MNTVALLIPRPRAFNNPPAVGEYLVPVVRENERGTVISAQRHSDDNAAFAFLPFADESDSDALTKHLDTLKNTISIATDQIAAKAKDVHPNRMAEVAFEIYIKLSRRPFKDLVTELQGTKRRAITGKIEFMDVHAVHQTIASAISVHFAAMDQIAILQNIDGMKADQLAVLLTMRGLIDLPERTWRDVSVRYVIQANVSGERSDGMQIAAKESSFDDPAAIGLDEGLLEQWAEGRFKSFENHESRADEIAASLKQVCAALAVACDKSPAEMWSALYD